jgi:hypothetical protein
MRSRGLIHADDVGIQFHVRGNARHIPGDHPPYAVENVVACYRHRMAGGQRKPVLIRERLPAAEQDDLADGTGYIGLADGPRRHAVVDSRPPQLLVPDQP